MTRPLLCALMLLASCAHAPAITEPVSQAPNLLALIMPHQQVDECSGVIKLEGEIGDPDDFVAALKACESQAVVIEINSPGGSVFGALEMQKAIERHPHPVICLVDGMAASAAFSTLQSCDIRMMTDRSILMVHHASSGARGQKENLENMAAALRALDRGMVLHVAKRMGMEPDELEAKISGGREWWMGLEEALSSRAVDFEGSSLLEAEKMAAAATSK